MTSNILTAIIAVYAISVTAFLLQNLRKEEEEMAVIYVALIIKGRRKFSKIPDCVKEEVRQMLIDLELEHLIDE